MENKLNHNRLAEGEVTGHAHRASEGVALYEIGNEEMSVRSLEAWYLKHEEHTQVEVPVHPHAGAPTANYVRRIVQEFDHAEESVRNIQD